MTKVYQIIRKYPLTTLILVIIWILCFMPIPETPLSKISFIDKWTHIVMYFGLCIVMWGEYLWKNGNINKQDVFLWIFIAPTLMGGLIEILQENCTNGMRSGDWMDFLADAAGVVIAQLIGIPLAMYFSTRRKDC